MEPVHSNDHDVDPENIVYMDSDSDSSEKHNFDMQCQGNYRQEVVPSDAEAPTIIIDITDEPVAQIMKEECIIDETLVEMDEESPYGCFPQGDSPSESLENLDDLFRANEQDIKPEHDALFEMTITPLNPPPGMIEPQEKVEEKVDECEEQFEIINEPEEAKTEDPKLISPSDTSLVDHQYSQQETTNNEFCHDIVHSMLKETGTENDRMVQLRVIDNFSNYFDSFTDGDENSQLSLFLRSLKKTLEPLMVRAQKKEKMLEAGPSNNVTKPAFPEVPMTQDSDLNLDANEILDVQEELVDLPATLSMDLEDVKLEPIKEEPRNDQNTQEDILEESPEKASVIELKVHLTKLTDLGQMLSDKANELKTLPLRTDDDVTEANIRLLELIQELKKDIRPIDNELRGKLAKPEPETNEDSKKTLVKQRRESSEFWNSSDSEDEKVVKRNRKPQLNGHQPNAVVSSTKEDSDVSDTTIDGLKPKESDLSSSSETEGNNPKRLDKEIEKLVDLSTVNAPRPVSSKKSSKVKKLKKKKRKPSDDITSLLGSSSDDDVPTNSSSSEPVSAQQSSFLTLLTQFQF